MYRKDKFGQTNNHKLILIYLLHFRKGADELTQTNYFTFTEYAAKEEEEHISNGLSFDAKLFRANKEVCFS